MQQLVNYLNIFEAEAITRHKQKSDASSRNNRINVNVKNVKRSRSILGTFGRSQDEQNDIWLSMENEQLAIECEKYGLKVAATEN